MDTLRAESRRVFRILQGINIDFKIFYIFFVIFFVTLYTICQA